MADVVDITNERDELALAAALRIRRPVGPIANGRCHFCDEVVGDEARWCDAFCRDSWERERG